MKKFACCAIVAVAAATATAVVAVVIFTIIIKYMFPVLSRAHRTVHWVVYKHHKFYREVRGGGARLFFLPHGAVLDILLVDGAVAFSERHIFDALVRRWFIRISRVLFRVLSRREYVAHEFDQLHICETNLIDSVRSSALRQCWYIVSF